MRKIFLLFFCVGLVSSFSFPLDKVSIKEIKEKFDSYKDEKVKIEGFVTQYIEAITQTTGFYFLKDDWGGIIKVRTSQSLPEVGKKYAVIGVVDKDAETEDIFISEESRTLITPPPPKSWIEKNWPYLAGGLGGLILILLIFVLVYALREKKALNRQLPLVTTPIPESISSHEAIPEPKEMVEGSTIKMAVPPPGTLKLLPGKFVVLGGEEQIKEIRFYKEKGSMETEVTFGRAVGPAYTHIQLKPRTVSAKHAKLIYAGNKFIFINFSTTNPTKINSKELGENDTVELKDGDKIEIGEISFEFKQTA